MPVWPIGNRGQRKPAGSDLAGASKSIDEGPGESRLPVLEFGNGREVTLRPGTVVTVARPMVDICIAFDTTASMSGKIKGLIDCMAGFAGDLAELSLDSTPGILGVSCFLGFYGRGVLCVPWYLFPFGVRAWFGPNGLALTAGAVS